MNVVEVFCITLVDKIAVKLLPIRQFQYLFFYKKNIEILEHELARLKFSRDNVETGVHIAERNLDIIGRDVELWLRRVEEIERQWEEILGNDVADPAGVKCLICKCPNLKIRYKLSRKARKMVDDVRRLREVGSFLFIANRHPPLGTIAEVSNSRQRLLPSRSSAAQEIMDALNSDKVNVIGICGTRAVGKTTMVEEVARRARSEENFDDVVVLQNTDLVKIQDQVAVMLGLRERLTRGTRTLIILDDVRDAIDLEKLGIPFGDTNSKVVLISRLESICIDTGSQKNFKIDVLSEEEAWDLFKDTVGECVENDDDLRDVAEDTVLECGGLPLEIVTTGKALRYRSKGDWQDALTRLTRPTTKVPRIGKKRSLKEALQQLRKSTVTNISQSQSEAYSKIELSYHALTCDKAKLLFLLCCQFPEDESVTIEMLVRYVQGLQEFQELETLESKRRIVCELVNELKECDLLLKLDESLVHVQDIKRRVGKSIASKHGNEMYVARHGTGLKECRHNDKYDPYTTISLHSNEVHELPTSLYSAEVNILWLAYSDDEKIEILADFFEGMEKLKVIHVRANFVKPLPLSLKILKNLQTLCLDFCSLLVDISFIGDLKTLEILSFFHSKLDLLPSQIGQLSKLKLLDLRCSVGPNMIPSGVLSSLKKLEELYTGKYFDVANIETHKKRNSANVKELNLLSQLKVLQISVDLDDEILQKLKKFQFENLIGFDFSTFERISFPFPPHQFTKIVALSRVDMSKVLTTNIKALMGEAENLTLRGLKKSENRVIELDREVFANLNRLRMSNCRGVELVLDSVGDSAITNLESLEIVKMLDLREISSKNLPVGSFGRLQELSLNGLPKMMYLWSGHVEPPSFGNLRILKMHDCNSMESLFPRSLVKCLLELQQVMVSECKMLKEVVSRETDEDNEFPKLKEVILKNLPDFRSFYPKSTRYGTKNSLLSRQVLLPNMETLDVQHLSNHIILVADGKQAKFLHKLQVLRVSNCESLEAVFDLKRYKHRGELTEVMLGQLETMQLSDLPKLTHIWRNVPKGSQGFDNLRSLVVTRCDSMKYLLLPSMAKMVANLQELKLVGCERMEEVIEMEDEESLEVKMMVIPQLRILQLENMGKLRIFWYGKRIFELPLLENVLISNCPKMLTFYSGRLVAPNLVRVQTQHLNSNQWVWKGDLNRTVAFLYERAKDAQDS
ncbi:hypothetical protein LguiA_029387 [Lonicera macranthoides]